MDFNAARSCLPSQLSFGAADIELGERTKGLNCRDRRRCRIVACASGAESQNASSSSKVFPSRSQSYALLKQQMEVAAGSEDYEEAARLRDSLKLKKRSHFAFLEIAERSHYRSEVEVSIQMCRLLECAYCLVGLPVPEPVIFLAI